MLIQKIGISKVGPIREPVELECNPHVNLLIGPNSCGKTTVLNVLKQAAAGVDLENDFVSVHDSMWHQQEVIAWPEALDSFILLSDGIEYVLESEGMTRLEANGYQPCKSVPMVFVPSIRLTFPPPGQVITEYTIQDAFVETNNILDFRRVFRMQDEYEALLAEAIRAANGYLDAPGQLDVNSTFAKLILADQSPIADGSEDERLWAENTLDRSWDPGDIYIRKQAVIAVAERCAREICREIMRNEPSATYEYEPAEGEEHRGITGVRYDHWKVSTTDATDETLTVGDLSSGTQGPLMWIRYVALLVNLLFIASTGGDKNAYYRDRSQHEIDQFTQSIREASRGHVQGNEPVPKLWNLALASGPTEDTISDDEWRKMPFVLLVDEIENHLHPTWQRRIIPVLREYFPNAQIFATTHSPFVVAGLEAGQVHLFNRDESGVVRASTNTEDIIGWTADEILRAMMEVDDPTDDETARNAAELRKLRDEGTRVDEREEEERQSRMQELRKRVNRNMLEGGAFTTQRKTFAEHFDRVLEQRRRSRDLNMENG